MQDRKMFDLEFRKLENLLSVKLMYANNVDLSSIQWRASSRQGMSPVGLRYTGKGGCDAPVRAVPARRAGTTC